MTDVSNAVATAAEATAKANEKTMDGLKQSAAKATAGFEQAQAKIAERFDHAQASASNFLEEGHETFAAYTRSTQLWAAGLQRLALQSATAARASIADATEHLKELMAAKSVKEAIEMQTRIVRVSAEKAVAEAHRVANAYVTLTEEALAPITARIAISAEAETARAAQPAAVKPHPAGRAS